MGDRDHVKFDGLDGWVARLTHSTTPSASTIHSPIW
jgi:hypothetical protein